MEKRPQQIGTPFGLVDGPVQLQFQIDKVVRGLVEAMRAVCRASYDNGGRWSCRVYQRRGQRCQQCGEKIVRIVQAGRSPCFCPACQDGH